MKSYVFIINCKKLYTNINFIDKDYIKKHLTLWNDMSVKYEFQNKNIEFVDAVLNAKKMLDKEIMLLKR